jgi:hypothetical protein
MANWFKKLLGNEDSDSEDTSTNEGLDTIEDINLELGSEDSTEDELDLNDQSEDLESETEVDEELDEEASSDDEEDEGDADDSESIINEMLQNDIDINNGRKSQISDLQKKINELKKQQGMD